MQAELALHCAPFHACIFSGKMLLFLKDMLGGQRFQISSAGIHLFQEGGGWSEQASEEAFISVQEGRRDLDAHHFLRRRFKLKY